MDRRPQLHKIFKTLFGNDAPHVYHQGPGSNLMEYPCIVYKLSDIPVESADNINYISYREYEVTVIDRDPDSKLREKVATMPMCRFTRFFVSDGLNHYVFRLNF